MKLRIDLITIITDNLSQMVKFYREVLGFRVKINMDNYVEFESKGVRFAITSIDVMRRATGYPAYSDKKTGQSFELAFPVSSPEEVDKVYRKIVDKGAIPIKSPENMPWNQRAAFFSDPDGNINEIFSER